MRETMWDTLIVGQGLAGSALAWRLRRAGERVCVVDDGHRSAASMVAAGLVNPLAGLRFSRRPELADWLGAADRWYTELADFFNRPFYHPLPMLRLFRSPEQMRFYQRQMDLGANDGLIQTAFSDTACPEPVQAPFGGFVQGRTGFVDLPLLLRSLRNWLRTEGAMLERCLDLTQLEPVAAGVRLDGLAARRLVFCDGARLRNNPWFDYLPLLAEKGEILNLAFDHWDPQHIINAAHWLVPVGPCQVRFGATHDHHRLDTVPTTAGRTELLDGLARMVPNQGPPRLLAHQAGLRPSTIDRYPLIGSHPEHSSIWVFNGFGARGSLSIPWYASCLYRHWHSDAALPGEANIDRFQCNV